MVKKEEESVGKMEDPAEGWGRPEHTGFVVCGWHHCKDFLFSALG